MNTVEFTEYRQCHRENSSQVGTTSNMQSTKFFPEKSWSNEMYNLYALKTILDQKCGRMKAQH